MPGESGRENEKSATAAAPGTAASRRLLLPDVIGRTRTKRGLGALAELERQQRANAQAESTGGRKFLTFAERQRLLHSPPPPWFPMLVALGMLCFFSMSLTGVENDKELLKVLQERPEIPFTPHEAEETVPRFPSIPADATDAETDQDRSLLRKTQELLSIDNVEEQQLEWLEKQLCLSDLLLQPADYKLLVEDAPAELATLIRALMQQSKQLKQQQQQATGRSRVLALLQQDLLTAAEIILIYRTLLGLNKQLSEEQLQRLQDILEIAGKRFREEWGIGISSTRYFPDVKDQQLYTRLVSVTALALEDVLKLFSIQHIEGNEKEKTQQKLSWQLTTTRLELERLLEEAKLPQQIADAFRVD